MGLFAPRAPKRLHTQRDVEQLLRVLCDASQPGKDRRYAAHALGDIGDASAVPDLMAVLPDPVVRGLAAEALGAIGDLRAVGPLFTYGQSRNAVVAASFERAINMLIERHGAEVRTASKQQMERLNEGARRFGRTCSEPVANLDCCPICQQAFKTRLEHSVWCRWCNLYITDDGWSPKVACSGDRFGQLSSESRFLGSGPMLASFGFSPENASVFGPPVNVAWHLGEDYGSEDGCRLAAWGFFMKRVAETWNQTPTN